MIAKVEHLHIRVWEITYRSIHKSFLMLLLLLEASLEPSGYEHHQQEPFSRCNEGSLQCWGLDREPHMY